MVDQLLQSLQPTNKTDYALYACVLVLVIAGSLFLILAKAQKRKSRLLEQVMNRYNLVHRALDDFMALAVASLPLAINSIVTSSKRAGAASAAPFANNTTLHKQVAKLQKVSQQIIDDNPHSAARSDTKDKILYGKKPNPFRSSLVWLITIGVLLAMGFLNYTPSPRIGLGIQAAGFIIGYVSLLGGYMRFGQARSLRRTIEREASLNMYLFNIRRDFIAHTGNKLQDQHIALITEGQQLSDIPYAKEYFNGLVMLAKISKGILAVHHGSDMSVAAPLLSVSAALEKQAQKAYQPVAKEHGLEFSAAIDNGLAFRIDLKDFERVVNNLVENAITYSSPGGHINLQGKRRGDRIIISVSDTGKGMDGQTLDYLFRPLEKPTTDSLEPGKVSLGLQVCKVILTRIGAELQVTTKPGKGTTATIIANRKYADISLDIPQRIGARSSQLS